MASVKSIMSNFAVLSLLFVFMGISIAGNVYTVGDDKGWTILGDVNYSAWASSKKFDVGDTLVFTYNKEYHNVIEVGKEEYKSCKPSKPIATYATGNDTVLIKRKGHYFFICGVPGHCDKGQKVDIRISKDTPAPSPSSKSPSESPAAPAPAPAPASSPPKHSKNGAMSCLKPGFALLAVVSALVLNFMLA